LYLRSITTHCDYGYRPQSKKLWKIRQVLCDGWSINEIKQAFYLVAKLTKKKNRISRQAVKKLVEQNIGRHVTRKQVINMNII
jgi:hypothetical protein